MPPTTEGALGDIAIAVNDQSMHEGRKLHSVGLNDRPSADTVTKDQLLDAIYMLATYAFDHQRKLDYIFKATRGFGGLATPELGVEIANDNARLYNPDPGHNWYERARIAEEIMIRLYREVRDEHEYLLRRTARMGRPPESATAT